MSYRQYKYKFYLNMNHAIIIDGVLGNIHPHTWEITMDISSIKEELTLFSSVEKEINTILDQYQDKFLNEIPPFTYINPTLENVCTHLCKEIGNRMVHLGFVLLMIEISETPSKAYIINLVESEE